MKIMSLKSVMMRVVRMSHFLEGPKTSTTNRKTLQSEREKQQRVRAPVDEDNEPDISNDDGGDTQNSQDEPFLEGPKRGTTNRKTSQSEREKQQQVRAPIDEDNEPEISNDEGGQDEPFLEVYGSGYVTECYVQEDSPFIETSTPAVTKVRTRSPLMEDSFALPYIGSDSPTHSRILDTANITQTTKSGDESVEDSESTDSEEEETIPLKRSKSLKSVSDFVTVYAEALQQFKASRNIFQHSEASDADEQDEEKEDSEDEFESVHSDVEVHYDYDFDNINTTVKYNNNTPISIDRRQNRQDGRLTGKYTQHGPNTGGSNMKYPVSRNDSGIGETPFVEEMKKQTKVSKKRSWKQKPLQVSVTRTPITPQSEQMEHDEDISEDVESDGESVLSQDSGKQTMDKRQRRKRKFVGWSRSGPSNLCGSSLSGTRPELKEEWYKEPVHVSDAHMRSYRGQHIGKPKKLSYEDKSSPYNQQEPEEGISDEEEIRREVQGLINVAGSEIVQAVRRKRHMIRSFFQRSNETMLSTIDSFWDGTQKASYHALEKYKSQFTEQVQGLGKQIEKTSRIVGGMEETFNTVAKQLKTLHGQRQVEEKRFEGLQHLQGLMDTELTKLKRRRNEQETTLRTELEKEMLKLQNKFLQDTRKQKEDYLKMTLNTLRIP
ncbi:spermatogenesis, exchange of chromosomal protein [Desmophyllum pertusum]|uniref:Spermatogenesis, exchange of chromosomal protein n=1 Tax=Desmophyllum pertusum TaxID=174260 RepID=A0A9W9ZU17_9CNID|nr:spermatogenesis, exchange of chromosomal protein [Desmophyllum pertusum]